MLKCIQAKHFNLYFDISLITNTASHVLQTKAKNKKNVNIKHGFTCSSSKSLPLFAVWCDVRQLEAVQIRSVMKTSHSQNAGKYWLFSVKSVGSTGKQSELETIICSFVFNHEQLPNLQKGSHDTEL